MILIIDGEDVTSYIAYGGLKWTRNDVDGPNTGRTMSGLMVRDRVGTKIKLELTCRPLKTAELTRLLNILEPEFVSVTYDDPMMGRRTATMYANNNPATLRISGANKSEVWNNITFPLVER